MKFTITRIKIIAVTMVTMAMLALPQIVSAQAAPKYLVTPIENNQGKSFRPTDINNFGLVTLSNWPNARLYDSHVNVVYDLNQLANAIWVDLDTAKTWDQNATPWTATEVRSINDNNQVVGTAVSSLGGPDRVFLLEDPLTATPKFSLLPAFGDGVDGWAINEDGMVAGLAEGQVVIFDPAQAYAPVGVPVPVDRSGATHANEINSHGDVVITIAVDEHAYVISPSPNFDYENPTVTFYPGEPMHGINDIRQICGNRPHVTGGNPKNRQNGGPFRFQYGGPDNPGQPGDEDLLLVGGSQGYFSDINELGDVAFTSDNRAFLYLEGQGIYKLDQHVEFSSPDDEFMWFASNRAQPNGINELGQIIVRGDNNTGFFLTPIDPEPGISVSPTSGLVTDEKGGTANFDVVLNTEPTADVTIVISADDTSEGTVNKTSLTFTPANWGTPQSVTITGVDDAIEDGNVGYSIVTAAAASNDPDYNGLDAEDVSVTNADDDGPSGGGSKKYSSADTPLAIPDNDPGGVASDIVAADHVITNLTVNIDITHQRSSDLEVYLVGPDGGPPAQLFNFSGDNVVADFNGDSSQGLWTLEVYDTKKKKEGLLKSWSITIDY